MDIVHSGGSGDRHSKRPDRDTITGRNNDHHHPQPYASSPPVSTTLESRMTELFVLAGGGTKPFWNITTTTPTTTTNSDNTSTMNPNVNNDYNASSKMMFSRSKLVRIVGYLWCISVCCKVLLFPAYKSTDFDVHRHWKALTYDPPTTTTTTIPMIHWYASNALIPITTTPTTTTTKSVETVHTLDYPPGFALFEYTMVNNWIVHRIFRDSHRRSRNTTGTTTENTNDRCFDIMDDRTIYDATTTTSMNTGSRTSNIDSRTTTKNHKNIVVISPKCQSYMRTTVIVFADTIYWLGALIMALSLKTNEYTYSTACIVLFVLLTFHPTLIWLDHVHFQYNGTMMGLLLCSIGLLLQANHHTGMIRTKLWQLISVVHIYHIFAITIFGLLLTLKHLYITNSLWYITFVLRRYCIATTNKRNSSSNSDTKSGLRIQWLRLLLVALCGSIAIALPFIPFLIAIYYDETMTFTNGSTTATYQEKVQVWFMQLVQRLFPFQRGLVHTYWAGNVWAVYMAVYKILTYVSRRVDLVQQIGNRFGLLLPSPDTITPNVTAIGMLLAQLPGLHMAWLAATHRCNIRLLQSFTIVSLGTFLFQYHAHEKAIVTSLLPCIVWYATIRYQHEPPQHFKNHSLLSSDSIRTAGSIVFDMNAYSLLGLYPLLFLSQELLLKVSSTILYLSLLWFWCSSCNANNDRNDPKFQSTGRFAMPMTNWCTLIIVTLTIIQLEIPYTRLWGKYEFMPLAVTSLVCAFGYATVYVRLICF